ncbi:hypothetical protein Tco_0369832 [Tanacetum coccineum]
MIHMLKRSKVLKDILSQKEKHEKAASSIKLIKNALADLGASVNLMPHSLFLRLGISELKATRMSIQLADRSELQEHLEYAFLQGDDQLPVVISSALSAHKKIKLLEVLKNHKGAIARSIADIKGIDSSFYTHKILMEDEFKLTV